MTDFEYDSYDVTTLRVAFQNLRKAEQEGFWLGIAAGFPSALWLVTRPSIQHKIAPGPITKTLSALIFGSLIYSAYIFRARQSYNDVAGRVNRKYSLLLNKAVTYN
jgi:hypothetical protein